MVIKRHPLVVCLIRNGKAIHVLNHMDEKPRFSFYQKAEWCEPVSICDPVTHRSLGVDLKNCHVWRHPNGNLFAGTQLALTQLFHGKAAIEVLR